MADAPTLLCLVGPTAAGKSAIAIEVAGRLGGEIVSVDSVQAYRGLDIGSSKPTAAERTRVPHHGLDLCEPTEVLDAARWVQHAGEAIAGIAGRGRVPVLVGGTGLYLRALLRGLGEVPAIDPEVRAGVRREVAERGPQALHRELAGLDPDAAARIAPTDPQRIGRALEVVRQTGRPLSAIQAAHGFRARRYPAVVIGLWPPAEVLRERIAARARSMLDSGWIDEVGGLIRAGVPTDRGPLTALGYREVVHHVEGRLAREDLTEAVARAHRRYAKRQLVWFRGISSREEGLVHLDPRDPGVVDEILRRYREVKTSRSPRPG
jgi:tRNA dimethylallyltransferase